MNSIKTFYATGSGHVSSTGFTNFFSGTPEKIRSVLQTVAKEFPNAVVINGDDDWYSKSEVRPETWRNLFEIEILAYFHSGISGISKSGIVIDQKNFEKLKDRYQEEFGIPLEEKGKLKIFNLKSEKEEKIEKAK